jgi:hypothetical protein
MMLFPFLFLLFRIIDVLIVIGVIVSLFSVVQTLVTRNAFSNSKSNHNELDLIQSKYITSFDLRIMEYRKAMSVAGIA